MNDVAEAIRLEAEYEELNTEIGQSLKRSASEVVRLGYLLKHMMEKKLYRVYYADFDSYLREELHMDYTLANRFIGINRKYSLGGDSEEIAEKYKEYSQGLLVEMLSMTPELEAKVEPDMTVKQVREIKRQAKQKSVKMKSDARGLMDHAHSAVDVEPDLPGKEPAGLEMIVDGEYREVDTPEQESVEAIDVAMSQPESEVYDEKWFVEQYVKFQPEESAELMEICRKVKNDPDRAKAIQGNIALYGYYDKSCWAYSFQFHNLSEGVDICIGEEEMHLTYEHFASELMRIAERDIATSQSEKSAYGLENREYQEGSTIAVSGCGKYDCFSCAQDCNTRQESRYCRLAPMGNPFPCTTMAVLGILQEEVGDECQFVNNGLAQHMAGSGAADPCCRDCKELCGYRCQRAPLQEGVCKADTEPQDSIDQEPADDLWLTHSMLEEAERLLQDYIDLGGFPESTVRKQKLIVLALAEHVRELERLPEKEEAAAEMQQELPLLKNDTQRKQWLNDYKAWGLWYRDDNIDVNYYKFDFIDGSRLVVAEHPQRHSYWIREVRDEAFYHLIPKNKVTSGEVYDEKYRHATHSETELIKFLKNLQKKD